MTRRGLVVAMTQWSVDSSLELRERLYFVVGAGDGVETGTQRLRLAR